MECDGASNGNDDDSQKTGYQCEVSNSCFSFDGFAGAVGPESFDGVDGGADGYDVDGGFDCVDGGFDGFDGVDGFHGVDGSDFGGLDGLGDSCKKERSEQ